VLLIVGGMIGALMMHDAGGVRVPNGDRELTVLTTPTPENRQPRATPTIQPTPRAVATPEQKSRVGYTPTDQISKTTPEQRAREEPEPAQVIQSTPEPTPDVPRLGQPVVVVSWSGELNDGRWISWNFQPGYYQLELIVPYSRDGARVEWSGTQNCDFETRDMLRFTQRCKMLRSGTMRVTNPTTFGLGAAITVQVRVTRF
jgi:hypothetical protein